MAPAILYSAVYATTTSLMLAVSLGVATGIAVTAHRCRRRRTPWRAVASLGFVVVGAVLAAATGDASSFFLTQIAIGAIALTLNAILLLARLPLVGLVAGVVSNEGLAWRRCRVRRRGYTAASLVILGWRVQHRIARDHRCPSGLCA